MGRRRFVLDLTRVTFITSMGLGVIVASWVSIRQAGGALRVCGMSPRVFAQFAVSGLDKVLETCDDLPSALSSF
jgi:anti-anti-sigma factor